jgi:hypothetical protein
MKHLRKTKIKVLFIEHQILNVNSGFIRHTLRLTSTSNMILFVYIEKTNNFKGSNIVTSLDIAHKENPSESVELRHMWGSYL